MTDIARLSRTLLGSRLNLRKLCEEKNLDVESIEKEISVIQCINCSIWVESSKSPDDELCSFCDELDTLKF